MPTTRSNTVGVKTICVIGAKGQLGHELLHLAAPGTVVHGLDVDEIDITQPESILIALERIRPQLVINAAAFTDVDACESHVDLAFAVNGAGPGHLALACRQYGCRLVHVSTDYVFDGTKATPYLPDDAMNPQSVYGRSKAEGERRVRQTLADHVIVRTSWMFGVVGRNFVKTILQIASERGELRVVTDQVGRPTYAKDLAAALLVLGMSQRSGTYHFCNAGVCSWNEFATEIVRVGGMTTPVLPLTTAQLGRPAPRPAYSVLDTSKLSEHTGLLPRAWQKALAECVSQLRCQDVA